MSCNRINLAVSNILLGKERPPNFKNLYFLCYENFTKVKANIGHILSTVVDTIDIHVGMC